MSKGGGSQTSTTTQKNEPWGPAQPYLRGALSDTAKWYSSPYGRDPFPGSTVVPFSGYTEQALGMSADRAVQGSSVQRGANNLLDNTLQGNYLNNNPWMDKTFDLAAGKVRSSIDSQFNKGGTYGSSLHQGAMEDNLGDLATKIYGGNYDQERQRQAQGMLFAPQLAEADYNDSQRLAQVGQSYEGQAGKNLQDTMNRYNFYQNAPYARLQQLAGLVNPTAQLGSTSSGTQRTPTNSNPLGEVLGTAATIASFFSSRDFKEHIEDIEDAKLLASFRDVPAQEYQYKQNIPASFDGTKLGPMAEDFSQAFGGNGVVIPMPQMLGAMWGVLQILVKKIEALEAKG
jgi:hypothetical protein